MSHQVLIFSRFPKAQMVRIGERYDLMDAMGKPPIETFTAEQLADPRDDHRGRQVIAPPCWTRCRRCGAIICYGTGYDGVDFAAAAKRKIASATVPAANAASVADLAMTLMLATTRRLLPADDYVRSGDGRLQSRRRRCAAAGHDRPQDRRLRHGRDRPQDRRALARRSRRKSDITAAASTTCLIGYHASLDALAEWGDILMVAVRAGADTQHVVDADILKKLGPGGTSSISRAVR